MSAEVAERSVALTPTWSVAAVLTFLVVVSLIVERSIHRLSHWLRKTHRKPLYQAMEKIKEELMVLGFISLLLAASSRTISSICIDSKFYASSFAPCTPAEVKDAMDKERILPHDPKPLGLVVHHIFRRNLIQFRRNTCSKDHEPFLSYESLEQLHRFIFVMAITHVSYSCLTMLLALIKIHTWRGWEEEACRDKHDRYSADLTQALTMRRQSMILKYSSSISLGGHNIIVWVTCFFRQFGKSVVRADYLTLRRGFILNHKLATSYDFHGYMIRSMEEEFQKIVGVSVPLWGFVVIFMLFDISGSNLYFWIAIFPVALVLLVGAKLQHVIATLAIESVTMNEGRLKPRDGLFWFSKPEFLLSLIHLVLFQNAFELASFFWFWWQFGYESCFIRNHLLVYSRLILGFLGQFLCSYSTLPLYALVTQMGTNYKAALIPQRIRETMHGWGKAARKRRKHRRGYDESTIRTETSTVCSIEEGDQDLYENSSIHHAESDALTSYQTDDPCTSRPEFRSVGHPHVITATHLLRYSSMSMPSSPAASIVIGNTVFRSVSMPREPYSR